MEQEKPFKTIEVVDSKTRQVCKVACMSCIRGHRTTSCGIPVCRTKIFWTVKRPGRPSNSCTCRYGATGGCKCVVAKTACPHKSKKGEKRTGECRCDEQGRYCCLIEPEHWTALLSLQKPTIDFFPTREALETRQSTPSNMVFSPTPSFTHSSPHPSSRMSSMPPSTPTMPPMHGMSNGFNAYQPTHTTLTPRFGFMGIGAPMGSTTDPPPDAMVWEGQAPMAPRDIIPQYGYENAQPEQSSCCQQRSSPATMNLQSPPSHLGTPLGLAHPLQSTVHSPHAYEGDQIPTSIANQASVAPAPAFDFARLQADYFNYQFPSAICQNCGLNGCTCRNCPPVFQNFGTTTWAQYCGRKHARDLQPTPPPVAQKVPRTDSWAAAPVPLSAPIGPPAQDGNFGTNNMFALNSQNFSQDFPNLDLAADHADFESFDLGPDFAIGAADQLNLSEFLMTDLNQSAGGTSPRQGRDEAGAAGEADDDEAGGGGCCCGG